MCTKISKDSKIYWTRVESTAKKFCKRTQTHQSVPGKWRSGPTKRHLGTQPLYGDPRPISGTQLPRFGSSFVLSGDIFIRCRCPGCATNDSVFPLFMRRFNETCWKNRITILLLARVLPVSYATPFHITGIQTVCRICHKKRNDSEVITILPRCRNQGSSRFRNTLRHLLFANRFFILFLFCLDVIDNMRSVPHCHQRQIHHRMT